jgi:hypothetical protein
VQTQVEDVDRTNQLTGEKHANLLHQMRLGPERCQPEQKSHRDED